MELSAERASIRLRECIEEAGRIDGIDSDVCARLADKLRSHSFDLVVAGQFKRGKSTLVNALVGAPVLPVGVVPLTSVVTILKYGAEASAEIAFLDGATRAVPLTELADYVTEMRNPGNSKRVREATLRYPSEWLRDGIRLVDTPGIGSVYEHNTEAALRYVPRADAVLFVASADQPISRAEADFLVDLRQHAGKIFCLLNKTDHLSADEIEQAVAFSVRAVRDALDAEVHVFPLSAKLALEGKMRRSQELIESSLFPAFDDALRRFLLQEREDVWLRSIRDNLRRLLEETRLRAELELKALAEPLAVLEDKLARFASKKQETLQARADLELLLAGEVRRLLKQRVEPDLEEFKQQLKSDLTARVNAWCDELPMPPLRALRAQVHARTLEEVRTACDRWRAAEDAAVAQELDKLFERHAGQAQQAANELARYSAGLFEIPYEAVATHTAWQLESRFSYKFWDEPGSLYLLSSALAEALPRFLGKRMVRRRLQNAAVDLIEVQSGRMRHDFEERLKQSAAEFRARMLARVEATMAGIEAAIDRGLQLRRSGEAAAAQRRTVLETSSARISSVAARLADAGGRAPMQDFARAVAS